MAKLEADSLSAAKDHPPLYSQRLVHSLERNMQPLSFGGLMQYYSQVDEAWKITRAVQLLLKFRKSSPQGVIFVSDPQRCLEIDGMLQGKEIKSTCVHSCQKPEERVSNLKSFTDGKSAVLVANTNTFGRGVNFESVGLIINFDMPRLAGAYFDRVGHEEGLSRMRFVISFISSDFDSALLRSLQNDYDLRIARDYFS
eukprot:Plantae.Rhodophyta-Palmaria_palmata.ctg9145.p1 GENE.Plantae.Rhodophyta-Palmaria_palmata.ctg9145~~Plantae.Rhodophyta-Palmaria_palmata.ctg9145.p1  ORF type:complete len:198 (+),score=11.58 Plantae.Rhodophyta-Palmaria_palmata.ctg9145:186-779(+)